MKQDCSECGGTGEYFVGPRCGPACGQCGNCYDEVPCPHCSEDEDEIVPEYALNVLSARLAPVLALLLLAACNKPKTPKQIGVQAQDFAAATKAAMDIWNGYVGCQVFVPGSEVVIMSTNGEPCGDMNAPGLEPNHAASSYLCGPRNWEVHVSYPGDLHDQACIIAHELGHVLGLEDGASRGVMSNTCPEWISVLDKDSDWVKREFCK